MKASAARTIGIWHLPLGDALHERLEDTGPVLGGKRGSVHRQTKVITRSPGVGRLPLGLNAEAAGSAGSPAIPCRGGGGGFGP